MTDQTSTTTPKPRSPARRRSRLPPSEWADWPDDKLLGLRLSDLDLTIAGTVLEERIAQLHRELAEHGIRFRPYFWLSAEWFTPEGLTGIAIPFYLAHPRLARLELAQMLEVEGGTPEWCLQILRHETGHAIDHAYRLHRRRRRQRLFGKSSVPYPEYYTPRPYSRRYVLHLDRAYAQSHPDEDFAESFAVWLNPSSEWQKRYAGWPAIKKIEYIEELMCEIADKDPLVSSTEFIEPLSRLRKTLRYYYKERRSRYQLDYPNFYDRDLRRLFSDTPEVARNMSAARFLTHNRRSVRREVARWTGEYQYTIDQVLDDIITRCRDLNLRLIHSEERTKFEFTLLLTVQTMNYLHSGRHRVWL